MCPSKNIAKPIYIAHNLNKKIGALKNLLSISLADDDHDDFEYEDFGFQFKIPIFKNAAEIFRSHKPKPIR